MASPLLTFYAVIESATGSQIDARFVTSEALPQVGDKLEFPDHGVAIVSSRRFVIIPTGEHSAGVPNPQHADEIEVRCRLADG